MPSVQTGASDPPVVQGETVVSQSDVCPQGPESGSRRPVEAGVEVWGMENSPRGGEVDMREVRPRFGPVVRVSRDNPLSTVVLSNASSPTGVGRHGTDMAEATPVRFSPDRSAPRSSGEGPERGGQSVAGSPVLAGPGVVLRHHVTPGRPAVADPSEEGPANSGRGHDFSRSARVVETVGLAPEGAQYLEAGLLAGVIENILSSRAPSTRRLYGLKWNVFSTWCRECRLDPVTCPVASVLEFLQDRFSAGLIPSTLKVYVDAIAAFHVPLAFPLWCMEDEACNSFQSPNLGSGCGP